MREGPRERAWAAAVGIVALGFYLVTLLPGAGFGDTAKFQFVGKVLGTPHATGYPTYLLLNKLFLTLVPFGNAAYRANLLSAVFAALAGAMLFLLLRALRVRRPVGALTALAFCLTPTLWSQAVVAEVYTLNILFVAATLLLFVRWSQTRRRAHLVAACAVYALSFGCHLTMITLLPAVVAFVLMVDRRVLLDPRTVGLILGVVALGALQYAYIFWRTSDPTTPYLEMRAGSMGEFLYFVSGAQFQGQMFAFTPGQVISQRLPMYWGLLVKELRYLLPFAALGAVLVARDWRTTTFVALALAGNLFWSLNYAIWDISVYFIPGYVVLMVFAGKGLDLLSARVLRIPALELPILALVPLSFAVLNYKQVDQSQRTSAQQVVERVLGAVGRDAVILSPSYGYSETFWYYLLGEGKSSQNNQYVIHHFDPDSVASYLRQGVPIYLPEERRQLPPDLTVYGMSQEQAHALAMRGLGMRTVAPGLFRVAGR